MMSCSPWWITGEIVELNSNKNQNTVKSQDTTGVCGLLFFCQLCYCLFCFWQFLPPNQLTTGVWMPQNFCIFSFFAISFESSNQKELRTEYPPPLADVLTCYVERFHLPRHTVINAVHVLISWWSLNPALVFLQRLLQLVIVCSISGLLLDPVASCLVLVMGLDGGEPAGYCCPLTAHFLML